MIRAACLLSVICLAIAGCGKRKSLTITSSDGSCVMHAEERERIIKARRHNAWFFSDSEPDKEATHIHFLLDGHQLDLPEKITTRIADPSELSIETKRTSATDLIITLSGPSASGFNILVLRYKDNLLNEAKTKAVDDDYFTQIYP